MKIRQIVLGLSLLAMQSCAPGKPEEKKTIAAQKTEIEEILIVDPKLEARLKAQPEQREFISSNLLVEARYGEEGKVFLKAAFFKPSPKNPLFPYSLMPKEEHGNEEPDHR